MSSLVLIAHNLRSALNVGALIRTAEGLGVKTLYLTGYTPYPTLKDDPRLPHLLRKVNASVTKTSLGAERSIKIEHCARLAPLIKLLKQKGYLIAALEQSTASEPLWQFQPPDQVAIVVGNEVAGLKPSELKHCQTVLEIPMLGRKESHNVASAAAMALYHCRFFK